MPFKSEKQRKYLFSQKPDIAEKFVAHESKAKPQKNKKTKKNVERTYEAS